MLEMLQQSHANYLKIYTCHMGDGDSKKGSGRKLSSFKSTSLKNLSDRLQHEIEENA